MSVVSPGMRLFGSGWSLLSHRSSVTQGPRRVPWPTYSIPSASQSRTLLFSIKLALALFSRLPEQSELTAASVTYCSAAALTALRDLKGKVALLQARLRAPP
ncbi:hypothetical protein FKP32DRAFT_1591304 [Trametes sanguinea]|nr:hypothetical protein FKP32DRAFT_1591304 [Trametes sanguinea]